MDFSGSLRKCSKAASLVISISLLSTLLTREELLSELKPDGYLLKSTEKAALLKSIADFFEKKKYEQLQEMQSE